MKKVGIVMGSDSDLGTAEKVMEILEILKIPFVVRILSAHRTPNEVKEFASAAEDNGFGVIVAVAGMAAHLGGVIASYTILPVIGVPCKSKTLEGLDALFSMVQMPSGVPVATVAIDNGANAAYLAAQIIALSDIELRDRLEQRRKTEAQKVLRKDSSLSPQLSVEDNE